MYVSDTSKFTFNVYTYTFTVPPSVIGPNHEHLSVVVNHFISLTCEVSGFPPPDLNWLKNEQPIKPNTNVLIVPGKEFTLLRRWATNGIPSHFKTKVILTASLSKSSLTPFDCSQ